MQPRERNTRERIHQGEYQWRTVTRKKPRRTQPLASHTCFVNHLPPTLTPADIAKIFRSHGAIADIHIPLNQKNPNHNYAFVQFYYPQSLTTAIEDENGRWIDNLQISVHPAKHDKPVPSYPSHNNNHPLPSKPKPHKKPHQTFSNTRDYRTYREAAAQMDNPTDKSNSHPITQNPPIIPGLPIQHTYPFKEFIQFPNTTKPQPSNHRIMSSRALGAETEEIRRSLGESDLDGDYVAAIKGKKCEERTEMLERSAVAFADSSQSSEIILSHILSEGVNCLKISPMGGMLHLITFDSFKDKKSMMESN